METHFSLTDAEFERLFGTGSLDPDLFTHEAHIRLAWIHIRRYGLDKACYNIVNQLQDYVKILGVTDKFNLTLTIASLKLIDYFVENSKQGSFAEFITEFPQLNTNFSELLTQYYTSGTLHETRQSHMEPDIMNF
ncbi:hypothetical protein HYN59_03885 [Flavobacterium album]|uniref:Uncharacterized protein n=1 Tax=Flavobacterium album TaxID=2175091 RepID=A0A2S1QV65_9FLAO|nr:hypothetical protein [Flavobacterium album]AWH84307.1 hypothetical protein HYN59_03885 [Flavobacterium album]